MIVDIGEGYNRTSISLKINVPKDTYLLNPHNFIEVNRSSSFSLTCKQINNLKTNKAFLIILETFEPVSWEETRTKLDNILQGIPCQNIIILSANLFYNYNKTCPYKVFFFNLYWGFMVNNFKNINLTFNQPLRHFQFLSRRDKIERRYFFYLIYKNNLLNKGFVTHNKNRDDDLYKKATNNLFEEDNLLSDIIIKNINNLNEYTFITDKILKLDDIDKNDYSITLSPDSINNPYYLFNFKTALDVVSETSIAKNYLFLSEKIIKTIIQKNMFLILGNPFSLRLLKSYGFKTFDQVFDESYDNILCPYIRTNKVFSELQKFCKLSLEEITKIKYNYKDIIDYNFNHLMYNFDFTFNIKNRVESYFLKIHKGELNGTN